MIKTLLVLASMTLFLNAATFSDLIDALREHNLTKMEQLVITEEDASLSSDQNKSILMYSVWTNDFDIVRLLVDKGAAIDAQDSEGKTALMLAIYKKFDDIGRYLIERGANVNITADDRTSALLIVGAKNREELLKKLEEKLALTH